MDLGNATRFQERREGAFQMMLGLLLILGDLAVAKVIALAPEHAAQTVELDYRPAHRTGNWEVHEADKGCTAAASYSDGTTFVLSYDSFEADGFLFLGNPGWRSVVAGREYPFLLEFPPLGSHSLRGRGAPVEGLGGFTISFSGIDLITQFMEGDMLLIQTGRNVVGRYLLDGSYGAAIELARCNRRLLNRVRPDPFAQ
ncbi:hypothetical protein [Allosphingosinicella sp.]|jgi:hypothetical protein|uniref:hypothetical protein n=1 Tax=Allosphingosinicella sp. TaxID=2823234 RepID=UPI002F118C87